MAEVRLNNGEFVLEDVKIVLPASQPLTLLLSPWLFGKEMGDEDVVFVFLTTTALAATAATAAIDELIANVEHKLGLLHNALNTFVEDCCGLSVFVLFD